MTALRPGDTAALLKATAFLKAETAAVRRPLRLASIYMLVSGVLLVTGAWIFVRLVNDLIFPSAAAAGQSPALVAGLLAVYAGRLLAGALAERQALTGAQTVKENLRRRMALHMFRISPLHGEQAGGLMNHFVEGLETLQTYYAGYLPARMNAAFIPSTVLAALLPADWMSALAMLITLPLVPVFMILVGRGAERLNQRQWKRLTFMSGYFLDLIQGLTTLKLFNASRAEAAYLARVGHDYTHDTMAVLRVAFLSSLVLEFFATVSIAIVAVMVGFRLLWGEISFLNGFYVLLLAPELYLPLRRLGVHYHARMEAVAAAGYIHDFLTLPELSAGKENFQPLAPLISFDRVSFTYPDGRPGLRDVSFTIPTHSLTLLAGASGSGKSTVLLLLLKFAAPDDGHILVNGIDLQTIDQESWWQQLGWVPQKPRLFTGTVGEAIGGKPDRVRELLRQLAIDWQPDMLSRPVTEAAHNLSGGQVQRLALARALARDPVLLLLDEPTAGLDACSRQIVDPAVQASRMTRLVATHHLAGSAYADQIILIEQGRLVAVGTHDELMLQSGYYRRCCERPGMEVA